MRILWLCSTMTPKIAVALGVKSAVNVSWIVNTVECLKNNKDINLGICFPSNQANA